MKAYNVVGIGIGPFNLSLAALIEGGKYGSCTTSIFLEKKKTFQWHEGMLIDGSIMQTHFLKDLVTPIDPSNRFSFLQYLKEKKIFYHFLNRKIECVSRFEFNDYMQWCASQLQNLKFSTEVVDINFENEFFRITTNQEEYIAKNIVLGTGVEPNIPICIHTDEQCFHSANYLIYRNKLKFEGKRVVVIGGSQSGAEIVKDILTKFPGVSELFWIDRKGFFQLQESCFDNELYSPSYVLSFHGFSQAERVYQNDLYYATSNGITIGLADELYKLFYARKFLHKDSTKISLLPHRSVNSIKKTAKEYNIEINSKQSKECYFLKADIIILSTGYKSVNIALLKNLFPGVQEIEDLRINNDYSIEWEHPGNKIFLQNGLQSNFGVPDANISLAAWRSGRILDRLLNKPFDDNAEGLILFSTSPEKNNLTVTNKD